MSVFSFIRVRIAFAALLAALALSVGAAARADQLQDIKQAGILRVATFDSNPPFGSVDPKSLSIVGYDVDFAQAIATALGVKLQITATNPANRIPLIESGKVDLIVADITITPERAKVIDFSIPYFLTQEWRVLEPFSAFLACRLWSRIQASVSRSSSSSCSGV